MAEMWISMGPQHPMTHGLWTLKVKVDGETIVDADPELGYLHRSVEKMGERRKYFMNTTLTVVYVMQVQPLGLTVTHTQLKS